LHAGSFLPDRRDTSSVRNNTLPSHFINKNTELCPSSVSCEHANNQKAILLHKQLHVIINKHTLPGQRLAAYAKFIIDVNGVSLWKKKLPQRERRMQQHQGQ
jgi:hypothetical protein